MSDRVTHLHFDLALPGCASEFSSAPDVTTRRLDLYVSTTGSDDYDGLTPCTALRTPQAAVDRVPKRHMHHVVIHVASGTYPFPKIMGHELCATFVIIGDGAGQSGDDGFVELVPRTAANAGSDETKVVAASLTEDEWQGKTIEILSGAARGDRRTIRNTTTTEYVPCNDFTKAVVDGDEYRVVGPGVVFTVEARSLVGTQTSEARVLGVGFPGWVGNDTGAYNVQPSPGLLLVNLRVASDGKDAGFPPLPRSNISSVAYCRFVASRVLCAGVEFSGETGVLYLQVTRDCEFLCGLDTDFSQELEDGFLTSGFVDPADIGLAPTRTSWTGWGIFLNNKSNAGVVFTDAIDRLLGFVVLIGGGLFVQGGLWKLLGGAVRCLFPVNSSNNGAIVSRGFQSMVMIYARSRPFWVRCVGNHESSPAVNAFGGGSIYLRNSDIEITGKGVGAYAGGNTIGSNISNGSLIAPGLVSLAVDNTISAPNTILGVGHGGRAYFYEAPTIPSAPAGAEVGIFQGRPEERPGRENPPVASSTFANIGNGEAIFNPNQNDGALVMRMT